MTIGEKIKYHRTLLGLTQTQFGERLGVKKNAVSKWECGRVDDIPASKVKAIAQLFDVPVSYLIDDAPQDDDGIISSFVAKALNRGDCAQKRVLRTMADLPDEMWPVVETFVAQVADAAKKEGIG